MALFALGVSSWVAIYYAKQPIVELEAFRQTETALTAYWMIKEGWRIAYQTPGWGYPWAAPIEFPIYQAVVALIAGMCNLPLEPVGRLVSFSFLIACGGPAFMVSERLELPPEAAWVFCALLWTSPLYLFWGRTFMIDTAAVFFALAAIPYFLDLREKHPSWRSVVIGSCWGSLGMLQRSITAGPILLVLAIILLVPSLRTWRHSVSVRRVAGLIIGIGLPLIVGIAWTLYADVIKSQNFVGRELTLQFRLSDQYVGSIGQRLHLSSLREIFWSRMLKPNAAGFLGVALLGGALWSGQRSVRAMVGVCLILAVFPVLLFFSVSLFLDYYQVSSVVFLLAALAVSCVAWLPTMTSQRGVVPVVASVLVFANIFSFWLGGYGRAIRMRPDLTNSRPLAIGDVIKRHTPEDSGVIVYGLHNGLSSISPEIPYLSERKGFTVPDWAEDRLGEDLAAYLGGKELGAIVFCSSRNKERYNRVIARHSITPEPHLFEIHGCHVWLPDATNVTLADGTPLERRSFLE